MNTATLPAAVELPLWRPGYFGAAVAAVVVMVIAIESPSLWLLNFVHVFSGLLWTGIDLFMGFVVGPIMRRVDLPVRRAMVTQLMPRMLYLMPTLAIITGTAGWFMAARLGLTSAGSPEFGWVMGALAIITLLTIQGLGILLPTNLRVCFEMIKPQPDGARIGKWMGRYVRVVAFQGLLQILIIVIMAHIVTGGA